MNKNIFNEELYDYSSDAKLVIKELEAAHPIFLLSEVIPGYEESKAEYIEFTNKLISLTEFRFATLKYFAILCDGHMSLSLVPQNGMYIDIEWIANNGNLYLSDKNKKPTNIEVINISGIPVSKITALVDVYYAAENEAARQRNYAEFCRQKEILVLAGYDYNSPDIKLATSDGKTITCKLTLTQIHPKIEYIIKHKKIDDVFYIDLKAFRFDKSIDEVAENIKIAVKGGIKKFIIDVRDNAGGNGNVGAYLLNAMG